jgi:exopolysaccharide biosynthesis WecB/TagA/CpsF family protein
MDALSAAPVRLLGVDFDDLALDEVVARLLARAEGAGFEYVVTPNVDHIERLGRIAALSPVYQGAMLCLLDSRFLQICARRLGLTTPRVVTGADLTRALLARLAGRRVAVVGMSGQGVAALAVRFPGVGFVHHAPPMGLLYDVAALRTARDFVRDAGAAVTFFAVGSPVQEVLAYAVAAQGGAVGVGLCVGAALEFCAGTARRAPLWMRRAGLEWLYRLGREPGRLAGRYLFSDPKVFWALLREGR